MVKVSDCSCCECDDKAKKQQIEERALSSVNKIYTFDARTYWPDGTGMVTIPLPTQDQLNKIEDIGTMAETVAADTARIDVTEADIAAIKSGYQKLAEKGSANGYAGLDNNGRVALANLYTGTSANQVPIIGKQLLANEMLVVDADGHTIRSKPVTQTLSFRGIYATKSALPSEGNVSGDYAIVSDGTAQADTGYYVWGYNTATTEYEWVWTILFDANNYQLISNLQTVIGSDADDSHYPSTKAAKDYVDAEIARVDSDVTNVLTVANRAFDAVNISDNNLIFERGNGGTEEIVLPSDEWEEIDLANWPRDWQAGDMMRVIFKEISINKISYPTNWTTAPTAVGDEFKTDYYGSFHIGPMVEYKIISESYDSTTCNPALVNRIVISNCIIDIFCTGWPTVNNLNSNDSTSIFSIYGYMYNGGGNATKDSGIFTPSVNTPSNSNLSEFIYKMWRKKA